MLCSAKGLDGFTLSARDGEIGHARELYFDDARWVVRHIVADTGGWLSGRQVLISPYAIEAVDLDKKALAVRLTQEQVKDAPGIDTDKPVSRQHETSYYDYYGYPYYWSGAGLWGVDAFPLAGESLVVPPIRDSRLPTDVARELDAAEQEPGDTHLRSSAEVTGYHIEATDGAIGHIHDFLFDDKSWQIQYVVIDTRNWLPGRLVLLSPRFLTGIDWSERRADVRVTREAVKASPPYDAAQPLTPATEDAVQKHYDGWL